MSKVAASTRLTPEVMRRLEKLGKVDRRSNSDLIAICVEEYLPYLEAEQEAKNRAVEKLKSVEPLNPSSALLLNEGSGKQKKKVA